MNIVPFAVVLFLASTAPGYAYSDPGSGLLILQLLGSALVGMLFYFSKIKNWLLRKVGKKTHDQK
jgi:hypothetical protein